jgi:hypothetical protein
MNRSKAILISSALLLTLQFVIGCAATASLSQIPTGNVRRLMERPDAGLARTNAPLWCEDALITINSLEAELAKEKLKHN